MRSPRQLSDTALHRWAWVFLLLYAAAMVFSVVVQVIADDDYSDWGGGGLVANLAFLSMVSLFPLVGLLITRRQPRNRIGWLLLGIGLAWAYSAVLDGYTQWALLADPGSLPWGYQVQVLSASSWLPPIVLMGIFLVVLFPDGRLPSRRWRALLWIGVAITVLGTLDIVLAPGEVQDVPVPGHQNPLALDALEPVILAIAVILLPLLPLGVVAAATALVLRFRRARGVERLQLKWLTTAGAFVALLFLLSMVASLQHWLRGDSPDFEAWVLVVQTISILSFGLIPLAIGVAVTRHGLYGIDTVISRALMVGVLGVFITGVYVAIVVGIGALIGQQGPSVALSVVATTVVAVAFQPARERVQRWVNRLVYGERATPYEVLADFASRVTGRYTTAELLPRLAETVSEGLGGARVEVWVRAGDDLVREVSWPTEAEAAGPVPVLDASELDLPGDRVIPVRHRDELLGALVVTKSTGEAITPPEDAMLEQVATQAGLVLRNLRLIDDLKGSRVRLVASQDAERRRLERNLHDGAQQSLVSVALLTRMAAARASDPDLKKSLSEAGEQLQAAINELRELARGIHPVVLTERGLGPALNSLAERSPVPVIVETDLRDRLPESIEATLYLVAAEAIRNAAQHAAASRVQVSTTVEHGAVTVEITDDGTGGADDALGTGLRRLADRVAAVDGAIVVHSPQGAGTRITCRAPVAPAPPAAQAAVLEAVS